MPNTLTIVFTSNPSTEPVEFPHPNTGVYVTGTQATAGGPWQAVHTGVTKGTYAGLTGRLKNYPTVSAAIAASGPVLNNVLTTPTGMGATATSGTALNVVVNSVINLSAYRLLAADTSAGTYTQIYQGTTASYPHTGLTAGQTKYYKWQYVGGGFYDDSPLSAVFSGVTTSTGPVVLTPQTADYGLLAMSRTDASGNVQRSFGSTIDFTSSSAALTLNLLNTEATGNAQPSGVTVLQTGQAPQIVRPTGGGAAFAATITLAGAGPFNGRIVLGTLERAGEVGDVLGRVVQNLSFATGSTSSIVAPVKKSECVVFITDSIGTGTGSPTPETDGWLPKLRALDSTRDYINNGYQSRQMRVAIPDSASVTLLNNELATASAGYTTVTFALCLGTNDYAIAPATLAGYVSNWLSATRTQFPNATLIVASPVVANSPYASETNMPAIRTALAGTITNQTGMRYVGGLTLLGDNTQLNTDGVHPTATGHITIANSWNAVLNPGAYQSETTAYLARLATAGGALTTPQKDALNTFVATMKTQGLYVRMQEFWPICGGVAASHALGFKNFANLTWNGTIVHSATGAKGDGSSGYGATGINPSTVGGVVGLNDTHISYYSRQNIGSTAGEREMGVADEVSGASVLRIMTNIQNSTRMEVNSAGDPATAVASTAGFFLSSRQASGQYNGYRNALSVAGGAINSSSLPNGPLAIMAQASLTGTIAGYSTKECAFASIGGGLTAAQTNTMYGALQTLQTALGRNV